MIVKLTSLRTVSAGLVLAFALTGCTLGNESASTYPASEQGSQTQSSEKASTEVKPTQETQKLVSTYSEALNLPYNQIAEFSKTHQIPAEAVTFTEAELAEFSEEFPPGYERPDLATLYPALVGATLEKSPDSSAVTFKTHAENAFAKQQIQKEHPKETTVLFELAKGNAATDLALRWRCAWIEQYTNATIMQNRDSMREAEAQIRKASELPVLVKYNPEIAAYFKEYEASVIGQSVPMLKDYLSARCVFYK
ncbi:MAG: hypothetical protein Q4D73_01320 [Actinomycetaceae bacterium]|nr:hypothetical protein [Actinomycetaceae bacterium]